MYKRIEEELQERNITRYRLAKEINIAPNQIASALKGTNVLFPKWKRLISEYFNIPEEELFTEEGGLI